MHSALELFDLPLLYRPKVLREDRRRYELTAPLRQALPVWLVAIALLAGLGTIDWFASKGSPWVKWPVLVLGLFLAWIGTDVAARARHPSANSQEDMIRRSYGQAAGS